MQKNTRILPLVVGGIIFAGYYIFNQASYHYTNYLWFSSHGQVEVWWRTWTMEASFYVAGATAAFLVYFANFYVALLRLRSYSINRVFPPGGVRLLFVGGSLFLALVINGSHFQSFWQTYVLADHGPATGLTDPVFGEDASFYMFQLAWYQSLLSWLKAVLILALIATTLVYALTLQNVNVSSGQVQRLGEFAVPHLAFLLGLVALAFAAGAYLNRFELVFNGSSGKVAGAAYTDVHARAPAYLVFCVAGVLVSIVIVLSGFLRRLRPPLIASGVWVALYVLMAGIYPGIVRLIQVNPNEFSAEREYIEHSIHFTRYAYGLDEINRRRFEVQPQLSLQTLRQNQLIVDNIRLWDYRPVRETFSQLQEIRPYYEFADVDVDRYTIGGHMRQVMIAARELDKQDLAERSPTWESRHLQYTHGFGIVMSPTNRVTAEGLPELWIKDFPPTVFQDSVSEVSRAGIYYGELNNDYVCVDTYLKEIDYPLDDNFAETAYSGEGGIELGSGLHKLLIAWQFDTWKLLISEYIKPESRILFRRNIHDAVRRMAPFLEYDDDPYIVLGDDGRLYWILDAYTSSDRFPYSAHLAGDLLRSLPLERRTFHEWIGANYMRNSVKVVIDAYDGRLQYYAFDEEDPILAAYRSFFPDLFRPISEMPSFLREHLRYPENLFSVQAAVYTDYHMDDPLALYNLEDRWQIATEIYSETPQRVEPYYTVIKLPDRDREEYILMLPFIPNNKQNMVAWMAARCDYGPDGADYGEMLLFDFPRTRQIYGPIQIESRIDQNPDISKDLSLWNQQGSRVIRGNLLVIPIADTLLYIEPIYLQSTESPFPELRRVVAADGISVVMGENLDDALYALAGNRAAAITGTDGQPDRAATDTQRLGQARSHLRQAREAAARGDWAEYGRQLEELERALSAGP